MDLIKSYVSKNNCLILAVSPANSDIANSDALAVARTVDPVGKRTIGVLTKLDLMDSGTDAMEVLTGNLVNLQYGFTGVINRSQQDIESNKAIKNALKAEQEFFERHPVYKSIKDRCGVPYLKSQLRIVLLDHIRSTLPSLKLKENEYELQKLKSSYPELFTEASTSSSKQRLIMSCINSYCQEVLEVLNGRSQEVSFSRLHGPARISYIFHQSFADNIQSRNLHEISLSDSEIMTVIQNVKGLRSGIFLPDTSFEIILKRHIGSLEAPSLECVEMVFEELQKLVRFVADKTVKRFTSLHQSLLDVSLGYLATLKYPTVEQVKRIIQMECAYINIEHPDFDASAQIRRIHEYFQNNHKNGTEGEMIFSKKVKTSVDLVDQERHSTIEGYLYKQGGIRKTWKKRYFRLIDFTLYFYNAIEDTKPKGQIKLKNCLMREITQEKGGNPLKIMQLYRPDNKTLFRNHTVLNIYATHVSHQENWFKALSKAIDVIQRKKSRIMDPSGIDLDDHHPNGDDGEVFCSCVDESDMEDGEEKLKRLPAVLAYESTSIPPEMEMDLTIIRVLLNSYFGIVRKSVLDLVPKAIILMMVEQIKRNMADEVSTHYVGISDEEILSLLNENPVLRTKKDGLVKATTLLSEAITVMCNLKL